MISKSPCLRLIDSINGEKELIIEMFYIFEQQFRRMHFILNGFLCISNVTSRRTRTQQSIFISFLLAKKSENCRAYYCIMHCIHRGVVCVQCDCCFQICLGTDFSRHRQNSLNSHLKKRAKSVPMESWTTPVKCISDAQSLSLSLYLTNPL